MKLRKIHKDCQQKIARATNKTYNDANNIIDSSFDIYYSQGDPKRLRTYTLLDAKKIDFPIISGDSTYLKAGYEGDQISYKDGSFTGGEVLGATMTGTYGVVGNPSYDEMAFNNILQAADKNFGKEFK